MLVRMVTASHVGALHVAGYHSDLSTEVGEGFSR